jgi:ribosomal protein L18
MPDDGVWRNAIRTTEIAFPVPETYVVVSKGGDNTDGNGSFGNPYLTIVKGLTALTASRSTLLVLPGEYAEAALVWPSITGLSLVAPFGEANISNSDAAAAVLTIAPTYTASTFEATIKGGVNLAASAQIGLKVANAAMTKKLNVYIDGLSAEIFTSGDSIDIAGTVAGQAIRVYAKGLDLEGLLHFAANDAGSRLRIESCTLMGGVTVAGAVAAELSMRNCKVVTGGLASVAGDWKFSHVGCIYATDADPAIYSELAAAYDS